MKKAAIALATAGVALVVVGCAPAGQTAAEPEQAAETSQEIMHIEDWKDVYPDVYASFMSGADDVKEKDGKSHSHAVLRQSAEAGDGLYATSDGGMGCISCKSADLNTLYDKYGEDVWGMKYEDLKEDVVDYWGCYLCHENDPGNTVTGASLSYQMLAKDYFDTLAPADAACGQCHNILGGYTRRLVSIPGQSLESLDPYRYGTDADAVIKAFLEDGDTLKVDEDGVEYFYAGHPDVEIFQGSNHQSLGLTCASCHMPTQENEDGEEYISHNASGSPLENDAALEYCLTCHKAQGIESKEAMVDFVKGKQGEMKGAYDEAQEYLDELHDLIVAGSGDEATDEQARDIYITARWYQGYANGDANVPGTKAAHAFDPMMDYYDMSIEKAKEGIALFA